MDYTRKAEELAEQIIPILRPASVLSENQKHLADLRLRVSSLIATALAEAAETVRGEDKWQSIMNFPKDAKTGSHWEVMAILDGDWRHLIARWFGDSQGFSTIGVCGFEVTHFRSAREPLDEINSFGK